MIVGAVGFRLEETVRREIENLFELKGIMKFGLCVGSALHVGMVFDHAKTNPLELIQLDVF